MMETHYYYIYAFAFLLSLFAGHVYRPAATQGQTIEYYFIILLVAAVPILNVAFAAAAVAYFLCRIIGEIKT
jgi:hypothetical protein